MKVGPPTFSCFVGLSPSSDATCSTTHPQASDARCTGRVALCRLIDR